MTTQVHDIDLKAETVSLLPPKSVKGISRSLSYSPYRIIYLKAESSMLTFLYTRQAVGTGKRAKQGVIEALTPDLYE